MLGAAYDKTMKFWRVTDESYSGKTRSYGCVSLRLFAFRLGFCLKRA